LTHTLISFIFSVELYFHLFWHAFVLQRYTQVYPSYYHLVVEGALASSWSQSYARTELLLPQRITVLTLVSRGLHSHL